MAKMNVGKSAVFLVCVLALLCALAACACAERNGVDGNIHWSVSDAGVLTISGNGVMRNYSDDYINGRYVTTAPWGTDFTSVVIESGVTCIGEEAFYGCAGMTDVAIPNTVNSIGYAAFYGCEGLTVIDIPASVTVIGGWAFARCIGLTNVAIPDSVVVVGGWTFFSCTELRSVRLPAGITGIGRSAFSGCMKLESVNIPESVRSIGVEAFARCYVLPSINFPDNIVYIGKAAFSDCSALTEVIIPNGVTSIENETFISCTNITGITIPNSVTSIGRMAFAYSGLTSVVIPDSVVSIGEYAFSGCPDLTSVIIGNGVTTIEYSAFSECENLISVTIGNHVSLIGVDAFCMCGKLQEITIPDSVSTIGDQAFWYCSELNSVTIGNGVKSIGWEAFCGCSSLATITIPDGVTNIGEDVFYDNNAVRYTSSIECDASKALGKAGYSFRVAGNKYDLKYLYENDVIAGLELSSVDADVTEINIIGGVTSIGSYAFQRCSGLTEISIPDGIVSVDNKAFYGCSAKRYANIGSDGAKALGKAGYSFRTTGGKCDLKYLFSEGMVTGLELMAADEDVTECIIPDGVTGIGNSAFYECTELTNVSIPNSATSIGESAFMYCEKLRGVVIPNSVIDIGKKAFAGCYKLVDVIIPYGVRNIGSGAFTACYALTDVIIPNSVTSISDYTFEFCSGLTSVTIPDSVTSIGDSAFTYCQNITSIKIPDSVTSIGDSAFYYCEKLTEIVIPDSITSIGNSAFSYCVGITSIHIPDSVKSIGDEAFYGCYNLACVTIENGVRSIGKFAFSNCPQLTCITIPQSVTSIGDRAFAFCEGLDKVLFSVENTDTEITFGSNIFIGENPTIYCHRSTAPHAFFDDGDYHVVLLEDIDIDAIRTIILPDEFYLACGDTKVIEAYVFPEDDTSIVWSSSDPSLLSVTDGAVTAIAPGISVVTATSGNVSATVTVETYIPVTSFELEEPEIWVELIKGICDVDVRIKSYEPINARPLFSFDIYSGDWEQASWGDTYFWVQFSQPGDVIIVADSEKGIRRECLIHVFEPVTSIRLTAVQDRVMVGREAQLTAHVTAGERTCENHLVTFASSGTDVATVDPKTGVVHGIATGTVTITATAESGKSASIELLVVDSCDSHIAVTDAAVLPTCTEDGATEGSHCAVCGEILTAQEAIPPLGHDWGEPAYSWDEEAQTVTGTCVCGRDEAHRLTETVGIRRIADVSPTESTEGSFRYVSRAFADPAFTAQEKAGGTIPSLSALQPLYLPAGLRAIGDEAFADLPCQAVIIPAGCTSIGRRAFAGCDRLKYALIPASVTELADDAFENCPAVIVDRAGE